MEGNMEAAEVFAFLESSNPQEVQHMKGLIHEVLNENVKETWMLYGLVDRYVTTNSVRCLDILIGIKEPHDKHLFDKLNDYLKTTVTRLPALTLLGHVVCKQPTWLYKIANHPLFPNLLKLLKNETDVPILMSALLVLVTLLPTIPANVASHLGNIFEVFTRLAAWKTNTPANIPEEYVLHLQVGVYALFHRLYGMYPCNFLAYLRSHFMNRVNLSVFAETMRPMLEHVRMHPLLVTASKEAEVSTGRWRGMETHDVLMECAKVSLDMLEGTREENVPSNTYLYQPIPVSSHERDASLPTDDIHRIDFATMSGLADKPDSLLSCFLQDGAAVVSPSQTCSLPTPSASRASPEPNVSGTSCSTQPLTPPILMDHPSTPGLRSRRDSSGQTGQSSQPSSPFRKIVSPFKFQAVGDEIQGSKDSACSPRPTPSATASKEFQWPQTELSHSAPSGGGVANIRPLRLDECHDLHQHSTEEDQEVSEIVGGGAKQPRTPRSASGEAQLDIYQRSDSVIHDDSDGIPASDLEDSVDGNVYNWRDFVRKVNRLRYYSQCGPSPDLADVQTTPEPAKRSHSCPDIAKAALKTKEDGQNPNVNAQCESAECNNERRTAINDLAKHSILEPNQPAATGPGDKGSFLPETQRRVIPYAYLFVSALPPLFVSRCSHCVHCQEARPRPLQRSPTEILDQHIQESISIHSRMPLTVTSKASNSSAAGDSVVLRNQVILLHTQLIFERNKREVHAERNRRLLARAKKARALEEQNLATKDQLQLQERHMADLNRTHNQLQQKIFSMTNDKQSQEQELISQIRVLKEELDRTKQENQDLRGQLAEKTELVSSQSKALQRCQSQLLTANLALEDIQQKVSTNEELRRELDSRNKELVLMGELQQKYREKFNSLPLPPNAKAETAQLKATFAVEIQGVRQLCEVQRQQLDAHKLRLAELEAQVQRKDLLVTEQKNVARAAKDEYHEHILALKEKYEKLRASYVKMVEQNLRLRQAESPSLESEVGTEGVRLEIDTQSSNRNVPATRASGAKLKEASFNVSTERMPSQQEHMELSVDGEILPEFDRDTWEYVRKRMGSFSTSSCEASLILGLERWQQACGDSQASSEASLCVSSEPFTEKGYKNKPI